MSAPAPLDPMGRLILAIVGVLSLAFLALQLDPVEADRARLEAAAADSVARTCDGVPVCVAGGGFACIDSATLAASPAPEVP